MKTDELIERIGREAAAVRPLPRPGARTAVWSAWSVCYLAAIIAMTAQPGRAPVTTLTAVQLAAALATGLGAAHAALTSVVPGGRARRPTWPMAGGIVWLGSLLLAVWLDARATGSLGVAGVTDWPCVRSMSLGGLVLAAPLVWMLRQGAPLAPRLTAFWVGLGALSVANIESCVTRPHAFAMTILLWHGGTMAVMTMLSVAVARRWLRWPPPVELRL
jgi:hypothetical protein